MCHSRFFLLPVCLIYTFLSGLSAQAQTLKLSHPYNDTTSDLRHRMVTVLERDLSQISSDLRVKIYPKAQLVSDADLWSALQAGTVEMALIPFDIDDPAWGGPAASIETVYGDAGGAPVPSAQETVLNRAGLRVVAALRLPVALITGRNHCSGPDVARLLSDSRPVVNRRSPAYGSAAPDEMSGHLSSIVRAVPEVDLMSGSTEPVRASDCILVGGTRALWYDLAVVVVSDAAWARLRSDQRDALMQAGQRATAYGLATQVRTMQAFEDRALAMGRTGAVIRILSDKELETWKHSILDGRR